MIEFIVENYQIIILLCASLLDLILFFYGILRKQKKEPSTFEYVMSYIPDLIRKAESWFGSGHGAEKKEMVMDAVKSILAKFGLDGDKAFLEKVSNYVESVLRTPQKKG